MAQPEIRSDHLVAAWAISRFSRPGRANFYLAACELEHLLERGFNDHGPIRHKDLSALVQAPSVPRSSGSAERQLSCQLRHEVKGGQASCTARHPSLPVMLGRSTPRSA